MVDQTQQTETISAKEFKQIRKDLGFSIPELTRVLNLATARTIRRWEDDETPVSGPVTLLMLAMRDLKGLAEYLAKRASERDQQP